MTLFPDQYLHVCCVLLLCCLSVTRIRYLRKVSRRQVGNNSAKQICHMCKASQYNNLYLLLLCSFFVHVHNTMKNTCMVTKINWKELLMKFFLHGHREMIIENDGLSVSLQSSQNYSRNCLVLKSK